MAARWREGLRVTILVHTAHAQQFNRILARLNPQATVRLLQVTDHGSGIPAAAVNTIFEPFVRLPGSAAGGTGLGLSLVRKIAQHHGGTAIVANNGPRQFTVKIEFPV